MLLSRSRLAGKWDRSGGGGLIIRTESSSSSLPSCSSFVAKGGGLIIRTEASSSLLCGRSRLGQWLTLRRPMTVVLELR
jgi:hypothetical protein